MSSQFARWRPNASRYCHSKLVVPLLALFAVCFATISATIPVAAVVDSAAAPAGWVDDLSPITAADWSYERAAHLIERAGFGATPEEIARLAAMTPGQAIDALVDYEKVDNSGLKPFDESGIWDPGMDPFPPSRGETARIAHERGEALGLKVLPPGSQRRLQPIIDKFFYSLTANAFETQRLGLWWANRMLATKRPLEEKLTLLWHGHFATGENKVRDYRMMLRQNEMLRAHASGRFRDLLMGILKDPAMLVYLDNGENIKSHPNENFDAAQHDFGPKTFLGRTGPLNGDDIIDQVLEQPVTGEFVAAKMYRFFVRDEMTPSVRADLGRTFRESGYEIKPLLKRMFASRDFYSPASYATQIKSPVQLVVSSYKKLGLREVPTIPDFGRMTGALGQSLFDPPNVAGWAGGRTWVTPSTLMQRGNALREVLFPDVKSFRPPDRAMSQTDARVGQRLSQGMDITSATREGDAESNMMVERDEDYNTRYGGYKGNLLAFERVKLIPRRTADVSLTTMIESAHVTTVDQVVDHFTRRFLRVSLADKDRTILVGFLRGKLGGSTIVRGEALEPALRELLYLVLSTPEYQVG